jgi:hypothetical protein
LSGITEGTQMNIIFGDPALRMPLLSYGAWRDNLFNNGFRSFGFRMIEGKVAEVLVCIPKR